MIGLICKAQIYKEMCQLQILIRLEQFGTSFCIDYICWRFPTSKASDNEKALD